MPSILGIFMRVAIGLAVLGTAPRLVLTQQSVIRDDDGMITTTTRSPSYHYPHYYYHRDARHAAADEERPPPPKRNDDDGSNAYVITGCPRDGAAVRALLDACPDISLDMLSAVRAAEDVEMTPPSSVMMNIEQLLVSPEAIATICRSKSCLDAIRASPCISSTSDNATSMGIALAEALCGCHNVLGATCQAPFRNVVLPISAVSASSSQSTVLHHQQQLLPNTSNPRDAMMMVKDSSANTAAAISDEDEATRLRDTSAFEQTTDNEVTEELKLLCAMPFHCQASLAEAEECAVFAPFLTHTYTSTTHCCNMDSDGGDTDSDDDCATGSSEAGNTSISIVSVSSSTSALLRRKLISRDAANRLLSIAMPDSIMALMDVFIDPPYASLVDGYLPPLARRVEMLREASIYGVGDAVTSPMRDICEWVSRSRDAESGAEGLFWDMLAEPEVITEVCRKVRSNGECLQTAVDVCFGGSTEDFIALADAALTEELISRWYLYSYNWNYYDSDYDRRERGRDDYRRGSGWSIGYGYNRVDWRTDAVRVVESLLNDIIEGAISAFEEYWDNGDNLHGDVQGLLDRVVGPMCTPACESLISSCEAVLALSILFDLDHFLETNQRDGMCLFVEPPLRTSGAKQRLVRAEAILSGLLVTVEDFTDALRNKFREDMAEAANVPLSQVEIIDVRAGSSVVVVTEVIIRADSDGAVEAYVNGLKAALDNPTGIFDSRYFGTVSWTGFGSSDPDVDESSDQDSKSSDADESSDADRSISDSDESSSESEESGVETVVRIPTFGIMVFSLIAVVTDVFY